MTTNKPEVVAWYLPSSITTLPVVSLNAGNGNGQSLIRLSDYEALQAEREKLRKDAERDLSYANSVIADQNNALKAMGKAGIMFVPVPVLDDAEKARYLKLMNDQLRRAEELAIGGDE